ncbi:hypothetical protein U1Q18_019097 [Sarracenia purpurea var. burkii]
MEKKKSKKEVEEEEDIKCSSRGLVWSEKMELFPAQPDLSLQISPPNTKPTSGWRRTEEEMDLGGFWKRALNSRNSISSMAKPAEAGFDLSLSNPRASEPNSNHFHPNQNNLSNLIHSFQQNHHNHHQLLQHRHRCHEHHQQQGLSPELSFLRPIRGIPVYQNPPFLPFGGQSMEFDTGSVSSSTTASTTIPTDFQSQGKMRSRFLSRFPTKRSMRAPRMRWTTSLHARFVHAVELLGGHESKN